MLRLFVALPLPGDVRTALAGLHAGIPGARWMAEENLHLTLRFIGEVDANAADDCAEALDGVRMPPFEIAFEGVGIFGEGHKARLLWAGVRKDEALLRLQRKVESVLVRAGIAPETRKFSPHITLARLRDPAPGPIQTFLTGNADFHAGPAEIEGFALYSSVLTPEGAEYTLEAEYPLSFN